MNIKFLKYNIGFSIIEVLIACAIISISVIALISLTSQSILISERSLMQGQATLLLEEGAEAVKTIRDNGWSNISSLSNNQNYYLSFNNSWTLSTTPIIIDGTFIRTVVFSPVYRDSGDDIVSSGSLDTGTKKVTVNVSWDSANGNLNKNLSFYLSNIFE